mgnify:CR=1 FL=1
MIVVAILETMWNWRAQTSAAGHRDAPRYFRINPKNHSGRRLYRLVGDARLLVTNACRELVTRADQHGTPDPAWLAENLARLDDIGRRPFDVLLVCGKVAQATFHACDYTPKKAHVMEIPHPAARLVWTREFIEQTTLRIKGIEQ